MSDQDSSTPDRSSFPRVGFVGLGLMGTAMAANLAAAGFPVTAYVRRADKLDALRALGLLPTQEIADLSGCAIVISMLPDDGAAREVFLGSAAAGGLANRLGADSIHLSMSTISTAAATELALAHRRRGQGYVAAPVFGNPDAARTRQLAIIVAGDPAHCARCRPLLESLGRPIVIGPDPGAANLFKLLGNMMTATTLEVLGEVIAVLRKSGQDQQRFMDIMTDTMFGSRVHKIYATGSSPATSCPASRCRLH